MREEIQYKLGQLSQCITDIDKRFEFFENRIESMEGKMEKGFENINISVVSLKNWKIKTIGFASGIGATVGFFLVLVEKLWN